LQTHGLNVLSKAENKSILEYYEDFGKDVIKAPAVLNRRQLFPFLKK